jgi:hypothetical protein
MRSASLLHLEVTILYTWNITLDLSVYIYIHNILKFAFNARHRHVSVRAGICSTHRVLYIIRDAEFESCHVYYCFWSCSSKMTFHRENRSQLVGLFSIFQVNGLIIVTRQSILLHYVCFSARVK